jgi:hypothetical protein
MIKKTRDPRWNEEFQFTLDQPPLHELIRIEVMSKRTSFSFRSKVQKNINFFISIVVFSLLFLILVVVFFFFCTMKESLGHVEINLDDVVHNGRINQKYHLIDSKNGVIHVEIRWSTV